MGLPTEMFGETVIRKGLATREQVEAALSLQRDLRARGQPHRLIGMIMLECGYLDSGQLIDVLQTLREQTSHPSPLRP